MSGRGVVHGQFGLAAPRVASTRGECRRESVTAALLVGMEPTGAALAHEAVFYDLLAHRAHVERVGLNGPTTHVHVE